MTRPDWRTLLQEAADTQHTAALTWQECRAILDTIAHAEEEAAIAVLRQTAIEIRRYADTFDDIGSEGAPVLLYSVAETVDGSADRIVIRSYEERL